MVVSIRREVLEIASTLHPICGHCCVSRGRPFLLGRSSKKERSHRLFLAFPDRPANPDGSSKSTSHPQKTPQRITVRGNRNQVAPHMETMLTYCFRFCTHPSARTKRPQSSATPFPCSSQARRRAGKEREKSSNSNDLPSGCPE